MKNIEKNFLVKLTLCIKIMLLPNLIIGQIFSNNCNGSILPDIEMGLPNNFNPSDLQVNSIQLPYPILIYPASSDEIYVIGGQPFTLDLFVDQILTGSSGVPNIPYYNQFTPYVVKINPLTLDTINLDLSGGAGIPYVGGVVAHPNGYLYAIAKARLFKINPVNMTVVSFVDLPLLSPFSIYNGINVASNGNLITKSFILNDYSNGNFLMINPDNLNTIDSLITQVGTARLNFACDSNGNEYIYHINQDFTFRVKITLDSLIIDDTWMATYQPYGSNYVTEPTSPRMLGDYVIYTTNTTPNSTLPMKLFWQNKNQTYDINTDTLQTYFMFSDTVSTGFSFFGLTTNEETGIFIGMDQLNGKIAAYTINSSNQLIYLWEKNYGISSIPTIEDSTGLVYINDFDSIQNIDYIVILDLFNGNELGRIATQGTVPSISNLVAGAYDDIYYCSNEDGQSLGYFHRVTLDSNLSNNNFSTISNGIKVNINPNPVSSISTIKFEVSKNTAVKIDIYNAIAQHIKKVCDGNYSTGIHEVAFDGSEFQDGIYFCKICSEYNSKTIKIIIRKK